ncbi:MAG: protein kinase [Deltaproteobacteria bacterium]|nr:MAG: protein kinase [Deltaproteobacteria bacterium]
MDTVDPEQKTIGRYEVVGKLAQGGMAEILLGRLTGPSGFERSVVIKRILPAFAEISTFVDMFLDEARIAARINHPNVVQHQELGRDDGQLFLVMEYLEGESLSNLQRRLFSRRVALGYDRAMYIVAEAAAGLHAAHEMCDLDGVPLGIVHRDISPQNLFVTYGGAVKVMDFGIAKAADRITVTEAGALKGKFDYMSPEQAEGHPIDRRSDVFSLGIVLYETTTGRRLFRRATRLASLRAVREGDIPPPSSVVKTYPPELERICLKALAHDREDRYPDAEAMRSDLLVALRTIAPEAMPQQGLREVMLELFSDRIEEKKDMLRRVSLGGEVSHVPAAEVDEEISIPEVEPHALDDATDPQKKVRPATREATGIPENEPKKSGTGRAIGIAALVLAVGVGVGALISLGRGGEGEPGNSEATAVNAPPEAALPPAEAVLSATVTLVVESDPPGAMVSIAGADHGLTPVTVTLPRSETTQEMTLARDGYAPLHTELTPDVDQRLRLSLRRVRARRRPAMSRRTPSMEPAPAEAAPTMTMEGGGFPRFN